MTIANKMKYLLSLLLVAYSLVVSAQQYPIINQHFLNNNLYNPAVVGQNDYAQTSGIFRQQWTDIQNAPQTNLLTLDGPVTDRMGLGLLFIHDSENIISNTSLMGMYSYGLPIAENHKVSFGLAIGFVQNRIDFDKVQAAFDNSLLTNREDQIAAEASLGIRYQFKGLDLNAGAHELFASQYNYQNDDGTQNITYNLLRQYIASVGYGIQVYRDLLEIKPKVLVRTAQGLPTQLEGNLLFTYDKKLWLGVTYREDDNWAASLGTFVFDKISIGYSYEMNTGTFGDNSGASHEFLIGYRFGKRQPKPQEPVIVNQPVPSLNLYENRIMAQEEKIDQLSQQIDLLREELKKDEAQIAYEQEEIEELQKRLSEQNMTTQKMILKNSVDVESHDFEESTSTYYVVVGSFDVLDHAKKYQRLLIRSHGLQTLVVENNDKTHYLVYTLSSKDPAQLKDELAHLKEMKSSIIQGEPWVYKHK